MVNSLTVEMRFQDEESDLGTTIEFHDEQLYVVIDKRQLYTWDKLLHY